MTTILSQQLKNISLAIGRPFGESRESYASVLYGAGEAAETDTQTIYSNSLHGLEQLSRLDARFLAYQGSLFSPTTLTLDPNKLTKEELSNVNKSIESFLKTLSPHFLSPGSFKTIEYLIRRYRVHQNNPQALVACGLPFHSMTHFVRLVQACDLEGTVWEFLKPMQSSGAALPREMLVLQCTKDKGLLRVICDLAKAAAQTENSNRMVVSLYAVLLCEILVAAPVVDEDLTRLLLPYLLHGVGADEEESQVSPEYRAASYMILVQLCSLATLAQDFLKVLVQQLVRNAKEGDVQQVVMVLIHLAATQPQLKALSKSALKALVRMDSLAENLSQLQQKKARSQPFLRILVSGLCSNPKTSANSNLLTKLIQQTDIEFISKEIALAVLREAGTQAVDGKPSSNLRHILRALDLRYPEHADAAINIFLKSQGGEDAGEQAASVSRFVGAALESSARAPLADAEATLTQAIDHPSAELRLQAVKQLDSLLETEAGNKFVHGAVIRRLSDDDPLVICAVLSGKAVQTLAPAELVPEIKALLARSRAAYTASSETKSKKKLFRGLIKQALKLLVGNQALKDLAVASLLNFGLATTSTKKLSAHVPQLASELQHPLLTGLAGLESAGSEDAATLNRDLVASLVPNLKSLDSTVLQDLIGNLDSHGRCFLLLSLTLASQQGSKTAARLVLDIGKEESRACLKGVKNFQSDVSENGPSPSLIEMAANSPQEAEPELLLGALLVAIRALPDMPEQEVKSSFESLAGHQPYEAFVTILAELAGNLGRDSALKFISERTCLSGQSQVQAMSILAQTKADNFSISDLQVIIPPTLAALSSTSAEVRVAAIPALQRFFKDMNTESLPNRHVHEGFKKILEHSDSIQASSTGLVEGMHALSDLSQYAAGRGKSPATPSRRGVSKAAWTDWTKFLLNSLGEQTSQARMPAAAALLSCLANIVPVHQLLQAALPLLRAVSSTPFQAGSIAEDLVEQILGLYTPEAIGGKADSLLAAEVLMMIFETPKTSTVLPTKLRNAALAVITPEILAAFPPEAQTVLTIALLETSAQSSQNEVRLAAQRVLESLPLKAAILSPLLQPPSLGPLTPIPPTPTAKRGKTGKEARSPQPSPLTKATQGRDPLSLLSSTLEVLQWKADIDDSSQLLEPLCQAVAFLLQQLRGMDGGLEEGGAADDIPETSRWLTSADYLIQLALTAMLRIESSQTSSSTAKGVDLQVLAECAGAKSSQATRNAALRLLSQMAASHPQDTLEVILQVIVAVGKSAEQQADEYSLNIGAATLKAVSPAWLSAGRSLQELVQATLNIALPLSPPQAVLLLSALVSALPQVEGLSTTLFAIVSTAGKASSELTEPAELQDKSMQLASSVCRQVEWSHQLAAFKALLDEGLQQSKDKPERDMLVKATALVTAEIQAGLNLHSDQTNTLQDSYLGILQNALNQLQLLGKRAQEEGSQKVQAAMAGVTALLEALEQVMEPGHYIQALLVLLQEPQEALIPRVVRLFEASISKATDAPTVQAAMQFCTQVPALLAGQASAKVKQSVMVALGALASAHGNANAGAVLTTISTVLAQVTDSSWTLRASALAAIAEIVTSLGQAVLPTLPRMVPNVLSAAAAAIEQLPSTAEATEEYVDMDQPESRIATSSASFRDQADLEVQAALAAVKALVEKLGNFISPYLSSLLTLLLRQRLIARRCRSQEVAESIRSSLASAIPSRLLLPVLLKQLPSTVQEGGMSVVELLQLTTRSVEGLDPENAAVHANTIWLFSLKVLAFRQEPPAGITAVRAVEDAAIALLLALTLKLTETTFKPLFLRLVDWAAQPPSSGTPGADRQIVLFKLVNALADQLRGVFAPYYKALAELMVGHLGGSKATVSGKRKRRTTGALSEYDGPDAPFLRYQVVLAAQKAFLYGQEGTTSTAFFTRLLSPIIAQLPAELPEKMAKREIGSSGLNAEYAMGTAVVSALVQMGIRSGGETMLKPLHHQVLMATRSDQNLERARALEVITQLVERLNEEYVILLPEAMPFLAELLEDPELLIQNKTRHLLRKLERITGESLDEYLKI